jgi:hypothetical protein|tara:strand:- start:309 stop:413 length:105 start_codon:yes stop_codon:yes gene_type:complete
MIETLGFIFGIGFLIWLTAVVIIYLIVTLFFENL